eukprot:SAG11_NODE_1816_length_4215_cov_2.783042_4_plen_42_part_00
MLRQHRSGVTVRRADLVDKSTRLKVVELVTKPDYMQIECSS